MSRFLARGGASLGLVLWSAPAFAQAAKTPLELEWTAPDGCPGEGFVRDEVAHIVGGVEGTPRRVEARARVAQDAQGTWHTTMTTRVDGVSGERSFEAESCAAATSAAALILAIAVNPLVSVAPPSPAPAPPPSQPVPQARRPAPPPPAEAAAVEVAAPRFAAGASIAVDVGSLPAPALGVEAVLAWTPGNFRVEITGSAWVPQSAPAPAYPKDGAKLQLLALGGRVAYGWALGRVLVGPLLSANVEDLSATGFGGTATYHRSAVWVAPGAGAFAAWTPARWFVARLTAQMGVPLAQPSFVVFDTASQARTPIFRVPAVVGQATLGAAIRFP